MRSSNHRFTADQATVYQQRTEMRGDDRLPADRFRHEPFAFVYYPNSWQYHDKHGFLPNLCKIVFKPGANGVAARRGSPPEPHGAFVGAMRKGGVVLDPRNPNLGPWGNYVVSYPTNRGNNTGRHFCWKFDEFERTGPSSARQADTSEAWWQFLVYLRDESGLISTPPEWSITRIINVQEDRLQRITDKLTNAGGDPRQSPRYTESLERLEAMRDAADRLFERSVSSAAPVAPITGAEDASSLIPDLNQIARAEAAASTSPATTATEAAPAAKRKRSSRTPKDS